MDREEFGCLRGKAREEQMRSRTGCPTLLPELGSCLWENSIFILAGMPVPFAGLMGSGLASEELCLGASGRHRQPWAPPAHAESQSLEKRPTKMSGNKEQLSR